MNTEIKRATMNGKSVYEVPAKSIINFKSGFGHKLLCDDLTFTAGTACVYRCSFCYVPSQMRKSPHLAGIPEKHEDIVIRRTGAVQAMRNQLVGKAGLPRFSDPSDNRVIYASPLVDVAGNMELVRETIEMCQMILELTHWDIRLLSKSNLLPKIALALGDEGRRRIIYGVSTGTTDDKMAAAFEEDTPLVSRRLQSLHWLQDNGYRTFGMICPSLPQRDYARFAEETFRAIRAERCEHVWAEVINVRGESMVNTVGALRDAGFVWEANQLEYVSNEDGAWEHYSRRTFEAHWPLYDGSGKLRFLQYVNNSNREYWTANKERGAVCL